MSTTNAVLPSPSESRRLATPSVPRPLLALTDVNATIVSQTEDLARLMAERREAADAVERYQLELIPQIGTRLQRLHLFAEAGIKVALVDASASAVGAAIGGRVLLEAAKDGTQKDVGTTCEADGNIFALRDSWKLVCATAVGRQKLRVRTWALWGGVPGILALAITALCRHVGLVSSNQGVVSLAAVLSYGYLVLLIPSLIFFDTPMDKVRLVNVCQVEPERIPAKHREDVLAALDGLLMEAEQALATERARMSELSVPKRSLGFSPPASVSPILLSE